ncbi:MAG: hypothetical protein OXE42_05335 [Gammaproteobacteria bacterium]|nr:hypothetical protein [Gammaproteobacteria bacterium]
MTPELIAVITIGIGLAGLILRQGQRLERRIDRLEEQTNEWFSKLEQRMATMEIQQAKLEGLLEGLREAVTHPRAA